MFSVRKLCFCLFVCVLVCCDSCCCFGGSPLSGDSGMKSLTTVWLYYPLRPWSHPQENRIGKSGGEKFHLLGLKLAYITSIHILLVKTCSCGPTKHEMEAWKCGLAIFKKKSERGCIYLCHRGSSKFP